MVKLEGMGGGGSKANPVDDMLAMLGPARTLQMSLSSAEVPCHGPVSLLLLTMEALLLQFHWTLPVSCGQSPHRPLQIC